MMNIAVLGIDLGKNSCSVAGLDETGRVVLRRRVSRDGLTRLLASCPRARWRWKRAAARTTWAERPRCRVTGCG